MLFRSFLLCALDELCAGGGGGPVAFFNNFSCSSSQIKYIFTSREKERRRAIEYLRIEPTTTTKTKSTENNPYAFDTGDSVSLLYEE